MSEQELINKEWDVFEKLFDESYPLAHKFYSRDKDAAWEGWQAAKTHFEETWLIENEKKILALESKTHTIDAVKFQEALDAMCEDKDKRIEALEGEVAELKAELKSEKEHSNILLKNGGKFYRNELALKAHINTLREALHNSKYFTDWILAISKPDVEIYKDELKSCATLALSRIESAIAATPAESLQAHDAETIKRYADDLDNNHWVFIPHDLRKPLKEGK